MLCDCLSTERSMRLSAVRSLAFKCSRINSTVTYPFNSGRTVAALATSRSAAESQSTPKASANRLHTHSSTMDGPDGVFSLGPHTLQIDRKQLHGPIRQNVVQRMQEKIEESQRGIAVLQVRSDSRPRHVAQ
jgi:hypothetical protein